MEKNCLLVEEHPLEPFLPSNATLLMLGSFPPQKKRWNMDFFYPNRQNDMWRIFVIVFFQEKNYFLKETPPTMSFDKNKIIDFLSQKGIALYDTATVVRRLQDNASDKFLEIVQPTDIEYLMKQLPFCRAIATTGQKATDILCAQMQTKQPTVGGKIECIHGNRSFFLYRMPSSSRAYPLKIEKKAAIYQSMFHELELV